MGLSRIQQLKAKRTGYTPPAEAADKSEGPGVSSDPSPSKSKRNKEMRAWFDARQAEMVGVCQCGCGQPSLSGGKKYGKMSCAHILPKSKFPSVALHPFNYVERAFWGGCHTNMDEQGLDRWPNMADWADIVAKFTVLRQKLTKQEKATKFYTKLAELVRKNPIA